MHPRPPTCDLDAITGVTDADLERFEGSGKSARTRPKPAAVPHGTAEPLKGPRRAMAQSMAQSRDQVALCTIFDDADIHGWMPGQDITARIIRAVAVACRVVPPLTASHSMNHPRDIWVPDSKTHVATMSTGDFRSSETSTTLDRPS